MVDRSHNETLDDLVMTGLFDTLAFYLLMITLFTYALHQLGWAPQPAHLMLWLAVRTLAGGLVAYITNGWTFVFLGLA